MPEIAILVENCGGQNSNNVMIWFLNIIKEGGFFGASTLHFYIKGHTKNSFERTFISLRALYQKKKFFTLERCCEILNTRNNVEVIQMFHEHFFDLVSFMDDLYDRTDPKIININHVFQVKKESAHIGYCQEFHGEAESEHNYKKGGTYINLQRKIIIRNIFKHLKQL